ncbi:MAG: ATP-dependent zinc metalloprotease FtsH [Gemmataceae bacterium]
MAKRSLPPWRAVAVLALVLAGGVGVVVYATGVTLRWTGHVPAQAVVTLGYGELLSALEVAKADRTVRFQKVHVSPGDVRGEVVTRDLVSGADPADQVVPFRAVRLGFERDDRLFDLLHATSVTYQGGTEDVTYRALTNALFTLAVSSLLILGLLFALRYLSGGSPFSFARSRHRLHAQEEGDVTFKDVAGIDEAVAELREVVDFLSRPEKYSALGGRIPKGVLLVGPPGTGKTLLARAVAGEAGVAFFSLSGSDFVEMFVGVGAARVRDLFTTAEARGPAIVFIDELDALGKTRSGAVVGSHDEREQTLNQLLVEMDGFDADRGLIVMAATNRPETLDPALLRPGRFDRTVVVDRPDILGREAILKVHVRNVRLGDDVDLRRVASLTPGTVGADLANLVNEAALMAARSGTATVNMAHFDEAVERGAVGLERRSRIMNADEKQRVAYHEAGHALVAVTLPNTHPVHKISIIPRGVGALGYVLSRPDEDRYLVTRGELESRIKVALGGTLAEELVYREISNGATSDLEQANAIARRMVTQFGMSRLGRVYYQDQAGAAFLDGSGGDGERAYSQQTAREIDLEVRLLIDEATAAVRQLLESRRPVLEAIARQLMEREVIDSRELRDLLAGHERP